ncbi:MAG: SRPBCC family protein [Gammaproteobacteria bacterium AqS3]|nr:SRPBCC family protein [Gammaproteobacteria bacterium AqS3]
MPRYLIERECLLPHAADVVRRQIEDIARYPEYLPGCSAAEVYEDAGAHQRARLQLTWGGFSGEFITRNERTAEGLKLNLEDPGAVLRELTGLWSVAPVGTGCRVSLSLRVRTRLPLPKPLLDSAADELMDAMIRRAEALSRSG